MEFESINSSIVQGSAIGPNSFYIYVADLQTLGVTMFYARLQMIPPYLFQMCMCDVKTEDGLEITMKWSNVNKLQLNLVKYEEIAFRRSNVQLHIFYQCSITVLRLCFY